jgi:rod shape-determining protein MreC
MAVSLVSILISEQGAIDPARNLSLTVTAPAQLALRDLAAPVSNLVKGVAGRGELARENQRLREELERYQALLAKQQDATERVRDLEQALGFKQTRPEDQLLAANVIAEDTSGLRRTIAIDRGRSDGLDEGMVVLSKGGSLIGTISNVYQDFAWVRLISDPDSAVNAQVNPSLPGGAEAPGVLTPDSPGGDTAASPSPPPPEQQPLRGVAEGNLRRTLVLDLLPADAPLREGDLVVTSGLGGNYPRALLIGTVREIEQRPQAPFKTATLMPAAGLTALDTVLVLMNFTPARLEGP